jgi:hypothetical protein
VDKLESEKSSMTKAQKIMVHVLRKEMLQKMLTIQINMRLKKDCHLGTMIIPDGEKETRIQHPRKGDKSPKQHQAAVP